MIKEIRIKSKKTQKELAEVIGVSQQQISSWENRKKNISFSTLEKVLTNLGLRFVIVPKETCKEPSKSFVEDKDLKKTKKLKEIKP